MYLTLIIDGQTRTVDMERTPVHEIVVAGHRYRPVAMGRRVRQLARRMWGRSIPEAALGERLIFEALDDRPADQRLGDSGSFSPSTGSLVSLGAWPEQATVAIALHEIAHEMHLRDGGYDDSDGVIREALALLAEREAGMRRVFEREPYLTASNLIDQLLDLPLFAGMPFQRRWTEISSLGGAEELSDLVNYYLDRDHGLGLDRWLRRYSSDPARRDSLMGGLAACSLRYSLRYRRSLISAIVRSDPNTPLQRMLDTFQAVMTLDRRYPDDDLEKIISFCFEPISRRSFGLRNLLAG